MCLCLTGTSLGLTQESEPAGRFGGEVEVTVVNLEVRVRDREDQPVTGLERGDFVVLENGEPVEISHFFEVRRPEPKLDSPTHSEAVPQVVEPGSGDTTRLVLVIDDENIHPNRRNQAFDDLADFFADDRFDPVPRITILRSSRGLKWVLDDSTDPDEARAALDGLRAGTGGAIFNDADFRTLVLDIRNASGLPEARALVRQYAQQRLIGARTTFKALAAAVSVLSGEPGRTILLYVGDGFPVEPGGEAFKMLDDAYPGQGVLAETANYQLRPELNDLIEQTNAAGITFSAYDARGLDVSSAAGVDGPIAMSSIEGFELDRIRRSSRQAPLAALTDATGGAFARTDNSIGNLLEVVDDDLTTYYSIGFVSLIATGDGERRIDVRVDRPGVTVRHKSSFTPRSAAEQRADATLAALFLDPHDNPLHLGVRPLSPEKKSRRKYLLPIDILIPLDSLVALPSQSDAEIKIELLFASCDENGTTSPVQRIEVTGPRPQPQGDQPAVLRHRVTLLLAPGNVRIAVTAHDLLGGTTASAAGSVSIP